LCNGDQETEGMTMKRATVAAALAAVIGCPAWATDVGVSVQISQPGVYGRIDIGRYPQPVVVYPQPVLILRPTVIAVPAQPVYMWVPPGHRKDWRKHCGGYGACGVPVYFVDDGWYDSKVNKGNGNGKGKGSDKDRGKGKDRDD
jgi:hypothetical protein